MTISQDEFERMTVAFVRKAKNMQSMYPEDDWLEAVVACVIADTSLVLDGSFTIEQFE